MSKKKSLKGKGSYASYKSLDSYAKNKAAKKARHEKRHPNDLQSANQPARTSPNRGTNGKGGFASALVKLRDKAGNLIDWPSFAPVLKEKK